MCDSDSQIESNLISYTTHTHTHTYMYRVSNVEASTNVSTGEVELAR